MIDDYGVDNDSVNKVLEANFDLLRNELDKESKRLPEMPFEDYDLLTLETFDEEAATDIGEHIDEWDNHFSKVFYKADGKKQKVLNYLDEKQPGYTRNLRKNYNNEKLEDIVTNTYEKNKILRYNDDLVRQYKPIYNDPDNFGGIGFRTHFYAPRKVLFGNFFDAFWFNLVVIWLMSALLYIPLYYDHLKKVIGFLGDFDWGKFKFWKKSKEDLWFFY